MISALILIFIAIAASFAVYETVMSYGVRAEKGPSFSITALNAQVLPNGGLYVSFQVTNTGAVPVTINSITTLINGKLALISYSGIGSTVGAGASVAFSGYTTNNVGASVGSSCKIIVTASANGGAYTASQVVLIT